MKNHEYTVEFRVWGTAIEPDLITRELGLQPCQVRISGTSRFRRVDLGMWSYDGGERDNPYWESLEEGLEFVLTKLWPHREAIARYESRGEIIWWCGHFQSSFDGGPSLSPGLLRKLGEFGAKLFIDNYFSDPDTPEA